MDMLKQNLSEFGTRQLRRFAYNRLVRSASRRNGTRHTARFGFGAGL
jgi:hypothetical protein